MTRTKLKTDKVTIRHSKGNYIPNIRRNRTGRTVDWIERSRTGSLDRHNTPVVEQLHSYSLECFQGMKNQLRKVKEGSHLLTFGVIDRCGKSNSMFYSWMDMKF